jgi:hypothetical protein
VEKSSSREASVNPSAVTAAGLTPTSSNSLTASSTMTIAWLVSLSGMFAVP